MMCRSSEEVVVAARRWLGTPYRHQASALGAGCDCLGLLRGVWRDLYGAEPLAMPPYRADWRDQTSAHALQDAARKFLRAKTGAAAAGDVVLFRINRNLAPKHCGIMLSETEFIHAQEGLGVVTANMTDSWARRVAGLFLFPQQVKR